MATSRPPGGQTAGGPQARIGIDLSSMQAAASVARAAGQATAREINAMFQAVRTSQQLAIHQARQATSTINAQSAQVSANARAQATIQQQAARATAQVQIQQARAAAQVQIQQARAVAQVQIQQARAVANAQRQGQMGGQGFGRFAGAALGGIGGPVGGVLGGLAGGAPAIAAGLAVSAGASEAVAASQLAVAYNRQRVAAVNLAGSQGKLNELMVAYDRATGGAIDRATALADVTRLQAVGFAQSAADLERYMRGVRGASIAMGKPQDYISQEVQLAISNTSFRRLDQIGLGISEVNERMDRLRATNKNMTREMAFGDAVLGLLNEKFGTLTDSAEGQATGVERLTKAWADLRLEMGQQAKGSVNGPAGWLADILQTGTDLAKMRREMREQFDSDPGMKLGINASVEEQQQLRVLQAEQQSEAALERFWELALDSIGRAIFAQQGMNYDAMRDAAIAARGPQFRDPVPSWMTSATPRAMPAPIPPEFSDERQTIMVDRQRALERIARDTSRALVEAEQQTGRQRASIIAAYEKSRGREAEDFARQRLYAERRHNLALLDVHQDSARQRVRWEEDLARGLQEQAADRDERVAEARADSAKRVAEMEEREAKDREKRQRDYAKRIRDAVASFDAVQVRELQRQRREEVKEAKEAHAERVTDEAESLQKRIDDANKAFAKQERQQRAALDRRIQQQAEDDALRIQEMKDAFVAQQAQEDEERGIRLGRQAEDHQAQLDELARAHGERITQIQTHAAEERDEVNRQHQERLKATGLQTEAWEREHQLLVNRAIASHKRFWEEISGTTMGPNGQPAGWPSLKDRSSPSGWGNPYQHVPPVPSVSGANMSSSRSITIGTIAPTIVIDNAGARTNEQIKGIVMDGIAEFFETYNQGYN